MFIPPTPLPAGLNPAKCGGVPPSGGAAGLTPGYTKTIKLVLLQQGERPHPPPPTAGKCGGEVLRAPRERQPPAASLYSGAMIMMPPYRPAATATATATATVFGAAIFGQGDLRLSSGEALKKTNSVRVLSNFAPVITAPSIGWPQAPYLPLSPSPTLLISFSPLCVLGVLCVPSPGSGHAWRFNSLLFFPANCHC